MLSRRVQRDLLLTDALLHQLAAAQKSQAKGKVQVDSRLFPAIVKLLDSVLQSLEQMRTLTIVDESPDLATAVDVRLAYTKAKRCHYLAWCYAPLKRYAEALSLSQHASIHLREARSLLTPLGGADAINDGEPVFYSLTLSELDHLDNEITTDAEGLKNDWFAYSGGALPTAAAVKSHKKPLFFDIALNYISLDMDRLQERAGKAPTKAAAPAVPQGQQSTEKRTPVAKAKAEEVERAGTPEPSSQPAGGGLSGLLGGWWGRR